MILPTLIPIDPLLGTLGCEYGQGYLFSPPVGVEAAGEMLNRTFSFQRTEVDSIHEDDATNLLSILGVEPDQLYLHESG